MTSPNELSSKYLSSMINLSCIIPDDGLGIKAETLDIFQLGRGYCHRLRGDY